MKRGTIEHPKMVHLAALLGVEHAHAVGIMESLWHWTATYAPAGDIGRYPNDLIADGIHWRKSAEKLISALVTSRWLDTNSGCRLIVHDWSDHAEESVCIKLARKAEKFADGRLPKFGRMQRSEKTSIKNAYLKRFPELAEEFEGRAHTDEYTPMYTGRHTDRGMGEHAGAHTDEHMERSTAKAKAKAKAKASSPNPQGGEEGEENSDHGLGRFGEVFEALDATGKFPSLSLEHLVTVDREFPKARLAENFAEIVTDAIGVAGCIGSTMPWLRKAVSALEMRQLKATKAQSEGPASNRPVQSADFTDDEFEQKWGKKRTGDAGGAA